VTITPPKVSSIIKLGGSLLDLPDLPARLEKFFANSSRVRPVLLCGGGPAVDLIRRWDQAFDLGEEASHWIALKTLTITALVLERIVPGLKYVEAPAAFPAVWERGQIPVCDAYRFIVEIDELSDDPLPRRWRVTSDSVAARMASTLEAREVVLLKSISVPAGTTVEEAARQGFVDPHFPVAAPTGVRVVVVNLREKELREELLLSRSGAASAHSAKRSSTKTQIEQDP